MLASALIDRSLRLINVPGQGSSLSPNDQNAAFEALQLLLDSKSVSRQFMPGIVRHFFTMAGDQHIYSYGPGGDLDTDDFEQPVPVRIQSGFIRTGGTIVNNEKVVSDLFKSSAGWTLGTGWSITTNEAHAAAAAIGQTLSQTVTGLTSGVTYDVKLDVSSLSAGTVTLAIATLSEVISGTGLFSFTFTATGSSHAISLSPISALTASFNSLSVRAINTARTTFSGTGSDYSLRVIDQHAYNVRFSKGAGGRPDEVLYSMTFPLGDLRFDNSPGAGDFLFVDVVINQTAITSVNDEIRMFPVALRWMRYALAKEVAPEYGKVLKKDANDNLKDARADLAAANLKINGLRIDRALQTERRYDINRGDY